MSMKIAGNTPNLSFLRKQESRVFINQKAKTLGPRLKMSGMTEGGGTLQQETCSSYDPVENPLANIQEPLMYCDSGTQGKASRSETRSLS